MASALQAARPRWFLYCLGWILVGGIADLVFTLWGLHLGAIEEANPVMAALLAARPPLAATVKLGVTGAAVVVFYQLYPAKRQLVAGSVLLISLCLLAVMLLHAGWIRLVV